MQNRRKAAVLAVAMAAGLSFGGRAARATSGSASFSDLVNFTGYTGAAPGDYPNAGLAADAQGNLYGTTYEGGADGYGTVYKLAAGTHAFSELASFTGNTGAEPGLNPGNGPLVLYNGFFYGGTQIGGYQSGGVIYKINASNGAFSSVSSGQNPYAGLAVDSTGHLYGGTDFGGAYGDGSVFKYSPRVQQHLRGLVQLHQRNNCLWHTDPGFSRQCVRRDQ